MISAQSPLLTQNIDWVAATRRYIKARTPKTSYTADDVDAITWLYKEVCRAGEVDLELCLVQMVHETDSLRSTWSQPPHRNPAGIGVTGVPGAGQSFETWSDSVECHVGLLLCYRFPAGEGTENQKRLINECLSFRPNAPRGVATTVAEMAAKWAADPDYVTKLGAMSQAIAKA